MNIHFGEGESSLSAIKKGSVNKESAFVRVEKGLAATKKSLVNLKVGSARVQSGNVEVTRRFWNPVFPKSNVPVPQSTASIQKTNVPGTIWEAQIREVPRLKAIKNKY